MKDDRRNSTPEADTETDLFVWAERTARERTRSDQILEDFQKFHAANPQVWELFIEFAKAAAVTGRRNYSAYAIIERIRWDTRIRTAGDLLKINGHYVPIYARLFHVQFPEYDGFFRTRLRTSTTTPACYPNRQVFDSGPPGEEREFNQTLRREL